MGSSRAWRPLARNVHLKSVRPVERLTQTDTHTYFPPVMSPFLARPGSARWPFWILLAAWWCANTPQAATFELILWFKGAAHFSHQQQLHSDVASLLGGGRHAPRRDLSKAASQPPPSAPLLVKVTVKRVDLSVQAEDQAEAGGESGQPILATNARIPDRLTVAPLLRPPRLA